jgi:dTDP-4-amino-4,6-dideoxygalactose transaminase
LFVISTNSCVIVNQDGKDRFMVLQEHTRPAILGGPAAVTLDQTEANRWPIFTERDEAAVLEVLRHGDLSLHPVTRDLEDDFRRHFGVQHALAHCNGTAALLAAFFALDLQPGDEVLAPSATHWASVVPMLWMGLLPVFCESEPERMGIDPVDAARKIGPRTRALVIVHLWGMPAKMTELRALASRHGLKVVEDASHAMGAKWRGMPCGTLGDVSIFSLQSSKLAPAGEGGILLTQDSGLYERAVCLGDVMRVLELRSPAARFAGTSFGMKTRMAPLSAAVARGQLAELPRRNALRNDNLHYLSERLESLGFDTFLAPPHIERVYFEYFIRPRFKDVALSVEELEVALGAEGCEVTRPRYPLLHQQPLFTELAFARIARIDRTPPVYHSNALPQTEAAARSLLRLPTFPSATRALLDQYVQAFDKVLTRQEEIGAHLKGMQAEQEWTRQPGSPWRP